MVFRFGLVPILTSFILLIGCQSAQKVAPVDASLKRWPVIQGATSDTVTHVSVLVETSHQPQIQLIEPLTLKAVAEATRQTKTIAPSNWTVIRLRFEGLKPASEYRLEILSDDGKISDIRKLKTLQTKSKNSGTAKFALISCMSDVEIDGAKIMWPEAVSHKPDYLFLIGDNVYADIKDGKGREADPEQLWSRYVETRRALDLFYFDDLIPTLAVWDDHDFGKNDGDKTYPHAAVAAEVFRAFFPQDAISGWLEAGPGLANEFRFAGQSFFFLDDRSFRTPNVKRPKLETDGTPAAVALADERAEQAHFGKEQEAWLITRLKAGRQPAWLISGDQFYGGYQPFESYEGSHPRAFRTFISSLAKIRRPLVFASGDRHLTEIIQVPITELGYPTYEFTSSPIHAKIFPDALKKNPSPRQLVGRDGTYNYMIIGSQVTPKGELNIQATSYGPAHDVLFEREMGVRR